MESKNFMESLPDSKLLRIALFIPLSVAYLMLLPFAIIALPFVFAWQCAKMLTVKKKKKYEYNIFDSSNNNKVNDLILDFNNWFNTGTGND